MRSLGITNLPEPAISTFMYDIDFVFVFPFYNWAYASLKFNQNRQADNWAVENLIECIGE